MSLPASLPVSRPISRRALLVIDVQNEYVTGALPIAFPPVQSSLAHIGRAIDAAHAAAIPVVVVQHLTPAASPIFARGSVGAELHPVVASRPRTHVIEKAQSNAFARTGLADWIIANDVDTLTIAGYMTHNCDTATLFHALHLGLAVELLADATGSLPYENSAGIASAEEIHRVFMVVMQSNFAAVLSTDAWIDALRTNTVPERGSIVESNRRARRV